MGTDMCRKASIVLWCVLFLLVSWRCVSFIVEAPVAINVAPTIIVDSSQTLCNEVEAQRVHFQNILNVITERHLKERRTTALYWMVGLMVGYGARMLWPFRRRSE